jgi:uncharacterized protein YndB with AHSA1/START domain
MTPITDMPDSTSHDLVINRFFDAPRELVYACWTDAEHLARWGGAPEGLTVTVEEQDIRVGGAYRICMTSPDGDEYRLQGVYRELIAPEKIVFTHAWIMPGGISAPETLVTIQLKKSGNGTELIFRQTGLTSPDARDGHTQGWNSTFDRLTDYLFTMRD